MWKLSDALRVLIPLVVLALLASNLPLYLQAGPSNHFSAKQVEVDPAQEQVDKIAGMLDDKFRDLRNMLYAQEPLQRGRKEETNEKPRLLYGVDLKEGFTLPFSCPWIGYNYVCGAEPGYVQWLQKWASKDTSPLSPALDPLPRGNSLWLGMSHSYQTASALICQHHWELQAIEVLRCDKVTGSVKIENVGGCPTKTDAYKNELCEACIDDPVSNCQMVSIEPQTRCENRAYPNVYGEEGTRADSRRARLMFKVPNSTREDVQCGIDRQSYPTCSFNVARFTFSNGHVATVIHNHVLQFYQNSLSRFAEFLALNMSAIDTIVYASPWELPVAKMTYPGDTYHIRPPDWFFFTTLFREDIINFAHKIGGFRGNLVFLSWHASDRTAKDILVTSEFLAMAQAASLDATLVMSRDVVAQHLENEWCPEPGDKCNDTKSQTAASHQCMPGIPDVVAWEVQRLLRGT